MTFDLENVRRDFPFLDRCLYLNTAAAGVAWRGAGSAAARFYDEMASRGYEGRDDWRAVASGVQEKIARLVNVEPRDVGFAGSTTEALNLITYALPVEPGDRVVMAQDEFPSVELAMSALAARGATMIRVPIEDENRRGEALERAARGARYVGVSHVHWHTGTKLDVAALARACGEGGGALIVDGIQAIGATRVDASSCDAYVASVFKWLLSGFGLGIVITSERFREGLTPAFRGYFNPPPSRDLRYGHINYAGLCALDATLAYLEGLGWNAVFDRTELLRRRLMDRLAAEGVAIATPAQAAAGIVSIRTEDALSLSESLKQRGVSVEARGSLIRVAPHFYNTEAEIDRFVEIYLELKKEQTS